ncbi:hypothetical protein [Streptomyces sp. NRRL S-118]|uniref:hypothetical protein n=1 Tax=Streptomyces sp. NRRL S-118 TaxID=1463881 RepID=UPI0004CA7B52|nr:hypothetical protein [Streptomyces sp. NRRL S-118]
MTRLHSWPSYAGRAALVWSVVYASGAALAALLEPTLGYALAHQGRGAAVEWSLAVAYAAAALLARLMLRAPGLRWPPLAAWTVVLLCLCSGFGFLFSPAHLLSFLSRNQDAVDVVVLVNEGVAVLGAVLWGCAALAYRRRARGTCPYCGGSDRRHAVDRPGRAAGYTAVAALVPYTVLKTAWALGLTVGYTGAGRPGMDPRYTSDLGLRLYEYGVDVTAVLALVGMALAMALVRPWGGRLPRLPLLALGWTGAGALAPFGIFLAVWGVLMWAGAISNGLPDHAPWVVVIAYGGFSLYGLGLARATWAYQVRTRRACTHC